MKINAARDIELVSFDILKQSKALGVFPTPIAKIVQYAELKIDAKTDLSVIPSNYLSRSSEVLKRALRKVRGALDRREKIIYIDPNQHQNRKSFVQLHEVGHEVLPWQRNLFQYLEDDEDSISANAKDEFEVEANYFASATLFQLDRFEEELKKLPLEIKSPLYLSKLFGASTHSAIRRYVEFSAKRCALLVLKTEEKNIVTSCQVRNYFQSPSFTSDFGSIEWEETLGIEWTFVKDFLGKKRYNANGQFSLPIGEGVTTFKYQYFSNSYNAFVLILPIGETNNSRTSIVFNTKREK